MQILIIGQGISGTNLAFEARKRNIITYIIDNSKKQTPSKTAAGMFNPVTFRVPTLSKDASVYFSELKEFYSGLERETGESFFHPMPYSRLFSSAEEQNNWIHRCARESFREFASDQIEDYPTPLSAQFGGAQVFNAGFVDTEKMLSSFRKKLIKNNKLIAEQFDYSKLKINDEYVSYPTQTGVVVKADYIIFAEGPDVMQNPLFNFLPFRPVKGQVLTIKIKGFRPERILSKGMFLIPRGNELFYAGATYSRDKLNTLPTDEGKQKILNKIKKMVDKPIELVDHRAGIRPATKDRNPMIGKHPQHHRAVLFNGMGSKAVSMTPQLADQLLDHLQFNIPLNSTVDLNRFVKD